jgi:anti-sigma factor RsiW
MNGHVRDLLPAYFDGELQGASLKEVEDHLKGCSGCRHDLDQLRKLSALLQIAPGPERQVSARRLASQVELRLKEPERRPRWQKALKAGWQVAPLGLLFVWGFLEAVLVVSSLIAALGGFEELLAGQVSFQELVLSLPVVFSPGLLARAAAVLSGLRWGDPFFGLVLLQLELAVMIAILLWGWVASYWVYSQHRLLKL